MATIFPPINPLRIRKKKRVANQVVTPQGVPLGPRNESPAARRARVSEEAKEFRDSQPDYNPPGTKLGRALRATLDSNDESAQTIQDYWRGRKPREAARTVKDYYAPRFEGAGDIVREEGVLPLAGKTLARGVEAIGKGTEAAIDVLGGKGTTDTLTSGIAGLFDRGSAGARPQAGASPLAAAIADKPAAEAGGQQVRPELQSGVYFDENNDPTQASRDYLERRRGEQGRPQSAVKRERATQALQEKQLIQQAKTNKALEGGKIKDVNKSIGEEAGFAVASIMSQNGVEEDFAEGKNLVKRTQGQVNNFVKRNPEKRQDVEDSWNAMTKGGIPQSVIAKYFTQWSRALGDPTAEDAVSNKMKNEAAKLAAKPRN